MKAVGIIEHVFVVLPAGYGKSASLLLLYESRTPGIMGGFSASSQPIHPTQNMAHSMGNCCYCNVFALNKF